MKKLLSLVLAAAMIMSMGVMSVSAAGSYSFGDIVTADGSYIDEEFTGDEIAPGSKVYVVIGEYDKDNPIKRVKVTPDEDGRDWVAKDSSADIVKLKDGSDRYECVEIRVKNASLSAYDEDDAPYTFDVEFDVEYKDSSDDFVKDASFIVAYREEDYSGTLTSQLALFVLEKEDELN
ncbi:MAG: hypothetical protein IKL92_06195, partial [Oscillospiraceae bacterium]|nr:hypothetical protein [Oscillospiraceae bacterium]